MASILRSGLERRSRHHVHLSTDPGTARRVGARHGAPVVLEVWAEAMAREGKLFYRAENGVWLTERVPPRFLRVLG
ncbi:RNA:NAD 2'-phosphotransferase (TPT1/KptA family) [Deinobacterium chartae]|uniref:RNA:NAD 2'-phosphotransferase (TPT1/KptA family) n=1 Tax=Deinobacterium chartae TaxID=521158 RepID=A0A841I4J6_9DEIO|nr:RNA:NAD 2'-phosphotransferase (TPT1/KptA family) [Deinobacterium chartae]